MVRRIGISWKMAIFELKEEITVNSDIITAVVLKAQLAIVKIYKYSRQYLMEKINYDSISERI